MANIVVTSTSNYIYVDFGIYGQDPAVNEENASYPRRTLARTSKPYGQPYIKIIMSVNGAGEEWFISYQAVPDRPDVFIVDSINGVAPTSLTQLRSLIDDLIIA